MSLIFFLILLTIISGFLAILSVYLFIVLLYTKVPFVKTPTKALDIIIQNIEIKPGMKVYDIGCGNAETMIYLETKSKVPMIGYELSLLSFVRAKLNILFYKSKSKVFLRNFYKTNLSDADIVFAFLIVEVMPKVGRQLLEQLKPGSLVVCYGFPILDWQPIKEIKAFPEKKNSSKIYIYKI